MLAVSTAFAIRSVLKRSGIGSERPTAMNALPTMPHSLVDIAVFSNNGMYNFMMAAGSRISAAWPVFSFSQLISIVRKVNRVCQRDDSASGS